MNLDKNKTRLSGFQGDQSKKKKGCECWMRIEKQKMIKKRKWSFKWSRLKNEYIIGAFRGEKIPINSFYGFLWL
jgi:hypothetical protein